MNGSSSNSSLPSGSFLSDAFVVFSRKLVKAISGDSKTVISVHGRSWTFFLTGDVQCARVRKPLQASKSEESRRRPDAAGARPFRWFLALSWFAFFFPLGFKFCCMVLRVANARALIIDLRRHYYLQLGLWLYPMNYTQKPHRDPGLPSHYLQFSVHIHYR